MPATSNTRDDVLAALGAHPGSTAAELADLTGLGRSTVGKTLASLESEGRTTRTPDGRDGSRRLPDGWSVTTVPEPAARGRSRRDSKAAEPAVERLGKGQLRALVLAHLKTHAGQELTPTAVAAALSRSAGAVGNAMVTLADEGAIAQTSDAPRRFSHPA